MEKEREHAESPWQLELEVTTGWMVDLGFFPTLGECLRLYKEMFG